MKKASTIIDEYNQEAIQYDRRWQRYIDETVQTTLAVARPEMYRFIQKNPRGTLLDIGCGTGAFTFQMKTELPWEWNIIGVDPSHKMLDRAKQKYRENQRQQQKHDSPALEGERQSNKEGICFVEGKCEHLPWDDNSLEIITTLSSFHFWTDKETGLSEINRVLRPNGILILSDWCHDFLACRMCALYLWLFGYPPESWQLLTLNQACAMITEQNFVIETMASYPINLRIFLFGPKWGMMTIVARKR